MTFRVETTAKRDLDVIVGWLVSQQAGEAGWRWFQGLRDAVASLYEIPERCALAPENDVFPFVVRQLLYGTSPHAYRVLFTIDRTTVTVLHIRHGRRQPIAEP